MGKQESSAARGCGSGVPLHPLESRYNTLDLASKVSVPRGCGPFGNPAKRIRSPPKKMLDKCLFSCIMKFILGI